MKKIWSFVKKDLLQIMRDREGYIWLLIMPIVFMVAMSFAAAPMYRTPDDKGIFEVSFLLVNQDSGSLGKKLVKQICEMENLKPISRIILNFYTPEFKPANRVSALFADSNFRRSISLFL